MRRFSDNRLQKCRDLENRVMGPSRSLEISPFDRMHTTIHVTIAISRVVSECRKYHDLDIRSEVTQDH